MKIRHVFSTPDVATARAAMDVARQAGVREDDLLLVARSDIELDDIPNEHKEADTDLAGAALRGAGYGGAAGLLAGLAAVVISPIGLTLAGAAATTLAGAIVGSWASALVGSSLPDPIRRKFDHEIKNGNILLLVDGSRELLAALEPRLVQAGATPLPYEETKMKA
ncbi:hypothetical protein [Vulcaniibacterium tengchongense]|uniref:DUF1269 domain-containing protein n=1 Tax=Vulcaniibacterium tengchongense TaxID=1273429 RepID=A0A3N4VDX8_9GAMM|nr:hypothetical protein [Vulcaniibacterium tengchongense]RPE79695.1 hypothetical protein EDC50_1519 [Vulcaniibacterium tengchongense]